ncbi:unnamed protein product [Trichobilharzia regenti]|nr:unnamed protein product [Trichobilharzia regenti]
MAVEDEESVESYHQIKSCLNDLVSQQWQYIRRPQYIVPFLQPGRLVQVSPNCCVCLCVAYIN